MTANRNKKGRPPALIEGDLEKARADLESYELWRSYREKHDEEWARLIVPIEDQIAKLREEKANYERIVFGLFPSSQLKEE